MLFIPNIIYFIPKKYVTYNFIYIYLAIILTPLHWPLFDNKCVFTILTKKLGGLKESTTDSAFSELYMRWFYEPLIHLSGYEWNKKTLINATYIHWIFIYLFLWYYVFFYNKNIICSK